MDSAKAFIDRLKSDETLLSELSNLMEKEDAQSIANLMRVNGVSEEGIEQLIHTNQTEDGELSDEALEGVAGGGIWNFVCNGVKLIMDSF